MTETQEQILADARHFVSEHYAHKVRPYLVFHSIDHTEDVAEAASLMADHYQLSDDDRFVLMLGAWFHDTGYSLGVAVGHEEESARIAADFLTHHGVDEPTIQKVVSAIRATKMPQSPVSLVEQILCDADLYHLSTEDFKARSQLLRQEQEEVLARKISKKDWRRNNIEFLENHRYFTDYGQEHLEPRKAENLQSLMPKKEGKKAEEEVQRQNEFPYVFEPGPFGDDKKDAKEQAKNTERGVQTMFRTTSTNHFELSSLADSKSNIMISVNSIILSVALTVLLARLAYYPEYILPTVVLLMVCLSSIIFAILATRPSINRGKFTEDDIRSKRTNLLFFGNFHRMRLEEYQWAMNELIKDREYLYNTMIKDIYYLGVVLAKKYKYLRISYTIFMYGIILTVLAFAAAAIWGGISLGGGSSAPVIDYQRKGDTSDSKSARIDTVVFSYT